MTARGLSSGRPDWRRWLPGVALIAVIVGAGIANVVHRAGGPELAQCLFRRITGIPCAACGGTRAFRSLATADFSGAFVFNPMLTVLMLASPLMLVMLVQGDPWIWRTRRRIRWVTIAIVVCVAANWAYVLRLGPDAVVGPTREGSRVTDVR